MIISRVEYIFQALNNASFFSLLVCHFSIVHFVFFFSGLQVVRTESAQISNKYWQKYLQVTRVTTSIVLTGNGRSHKNWNDLSSTNEAPGSLHDFKLDQLIGIHFQSVEISSAKYSKPPGIQSVGIEVFGHKKQQGENATPHAASLAQMTFTNWALFAVADDYVSLRQTADEEAES